MCSLNQLKLSFWNYHTDKAGFVLVGKKGKSSITMEISITESKDVIVRNKASRDISDMQATTLYVHALLYRPLISCLED